MSAMKFRIRRHRPDGTENRRYHKFIYTAALRLGTVPVPDGDSVAFTFEGEPTDAVVAHEGNTAFRGSLELNGRTFADLILIARTGPGHPAFVTMWPVTQHPDAHRSYTDPLVDTAMDGTPFDPEVVASEMHRHFVDNAGVSPATLMKLLYEHESATLREAAERYGRLIEEALSLADEQGARADREAQKAQAMAAKAEAHRESADRERQLRENAEAELERFRARAYIQAPSDADVVQGGVATLEDVKVEPRGKAGRPAVVLVMSDGTERANNWPRGFDERLEYARRLKGRRIRTTVWGGYDAARWFQNIVQV